MSDSSKAEKLAAARKKLKEFQQKQKEPNVNMQATATLLRPAPNSTLIESEETSAKNYYSNENVPIRNYNGVMNGSNQASTPLFSFGYSNVIQGENFFDNIKSSNPLKHEDPVSLNDYVDFTPEMNEINYSTSQALHSRITPSFKTSVDMSSSSSSKSEEDLSKKQITDLENLLLAERKSNEELRRKVTECNDHVLSLQNEIRKLHLEAGNRVSLELSNKEKEMKLQQQTIGILVSEKSELQKELMVLQDENKVNKSTCEELAGRLKASRSQVQKLEKELADRSEAKNLHNGILKKLEDELRMKESSISEIKKELSDSQNMIKELEKKVQLGAKEQEEMKKQLDAKEKELSMARIRLTQLGKEGDEERVQELEALKLQLQSAKNELAAVREEGQRKESELKEYITGLGEQLATCNNRYEEAIAAQEELSAREESLVKHLSDLEKQLQKEKQIRESAKEEKPQNNEELNKLTEIVAKLEGELNEKKEELAHALMALTQADEKILVAEKRAEEVPDMKLLQAAMESDRVAASRAIQQNNNLKDRLRELEEYIIRMNNNKLELTEDLDKHRHMVAEMRLRMQQHKSRQEMRMVDSVSQTALVHRADFNAQTTYEDIAPFVKEHEPVPVDAMIMLEEKLRRTMDRVADLSDEKQRLEHLVLQLQSETETIGEYVTLYQNQRSLLQERAKERERQMTLIAKEREELKFKLSQINSLLSQSSQELETTSKISSLVNEIQSSSLVQERLEPPPSFHPCLVCSGKLINV